MQFIDLKRQYARMEENILLRIKEVLDSGQYIMGSQIQDLEERLANFVGVKHVISNSSGTDALLMSLMALGIGPGDEVITSAFSFFGTAEVILLCHATPVFVDIDPVTYNLDPHKLEQAITSKTKAIMPVCLYGHCADFDKINQIAAQHNLPVIEDAAQSFGATYHDRSSCALATIGCTSFFPSKPLGAYGDAGACFTDDDDIAQLLRDIRNHGQRIRYEHYTVGLNGRMDTIQAAILLEKLNYFPEEVELRQQVAQRYERLLSGVVKTPTVLTGNTSVFAQYTIEVPNRSAFQTAMTEQGIPTAVHYPIVMHKQKIFNGLAVQDKHFPCAELASNHVVSLPMHPYLTEQEQQQIAAAVSHAIECASEVA